MLDFEKILEREECLVVFIVVVVFVVVVVFRRVVSEKKVDLFLVLWSKLRNGVLLI